MSVIFAIQIKDTTYSLSIYPFDWRLSGVAMASAQIDLMKTGLNETGLSTQLYETLVKLDQQNNQQLMSAISSFAAALGGGGGNFRQQQNQA